MQSVAHCTAAGRSSRAAGCPHHLGERTSLRPAHNPNTQLPHAAQCSGWRPGSCWLQQPGAQPMQAGMRGSAHQKTTPHTPARKAHDSGSVCDMRAAALLCRALQTTQCCVDLQAPATQKAPTYQAGRIQRQKARAQPMGHKRATCTRPTTTQKPACCKERKAGSQTRRHAGHIRSQHSVMAVRVKWLEYNKKDHTLWSSAATLCVCYAGQHADNTGVCSKPTPQQSKAGRLTLCRGGAHPDSTRTQQACAQTSTRAARRWLLPGKA